MKGGEETCHKGVEGVEGRKEKRKRERGEGEKMKS